MARKLKAEEKCQIMLRIFQSKRDFFQLKDIEKMAVKQGITLQTVKETLQSLVDDNLVTQEKLGISNYYWSFAKDEGQSLIDTKNKLSCEKNNLIYNIEDFNLKFEKEKIGREESEERQNLIYSFLNLDKILIEQEKNMKKYAECDPRVFLKKKEDIVKMKEEINKITDGLFSMQSYVCDKFGMERNEFNKNFSIDQEMDYIE